MKTYICDPVIPGNGGYFTINCLHMEIRDGVAVFSEANGIVASIPVLNYTIRLSSINSL